MQKILIIEDDKVIARTLKEHLCKWDYDADFVVIITTLIISKKPGNTGISRDIRTEFTTDLLLSD